MPARLSLRKLASELGLHSSTVSRALNGHPAIDAATVARVKKAAERLGYVPNPDVAVAMRAIRRATANSMHGIFGVLNFHKELPMNQPGGSGMPIYSGILRRAARLGWVADLISVQQEMLSPERLRGILRARNISGIILLPPPLNELFPEYDLAGFQIVATSPVWNEAPGLTNVTTVLPNHWQNGLILMNALRDQGFRRPLFYLHRSIEYRHTDATLSAFLHSQFEKFWDENIPVYDAPLEKLRFLKVFRQHRPDVVIGPDSFVKTFLEEDLRLTIPKDTSFVTYARLVEGIAGLDTQTSIIGEAAVDMLTSMVIHADDLPLGTQRTIHILGRFVSGPTLRKKPHRSRMAR
jgi:DNA-binding LacI/PurR family transcriptional regulator